MSEMVERVAAAIRSLPSSDLGMPIYETDYLAIARAALAAMRKPPAECVADPYWFLNHVDGATYDGGVPPLAAWRAMIDKALDTPEKIG